MEGGGGGGDRRGISDSEGGGDAREDGRES